MHPFQGRQRVSFGSGAPPPRDILILLGVVFVTYSMQFFKTTAILLAWLRLTPDVWRFGAVWQAATYPFVGYGGPSIWILLELLILFWFGRDVYWRLGRKNFWKLVLYATIGAAVVGLVIQLVAYFATGRVGPHTLELMQGQRMLITVLIASFATLFGNATILLFFVLPIQARWFIPIEIAIAFIAFLGTKDLAGFLGICTGVGIAWVLLSGPAGVHGLRRRGRELWLRFQQRWMRRRLDRLQRQRQERRRKSGFKVVSSQDDDEDDGMPRGPWVN